MNQKQVISNQYLMSLHQPKKWQKFNVFSLRFLNRFLTQKIICYFLSSFLSQLCTYTRHILFISLSTWIVFIRLHWFSKILRKSLKFNKKKKLHLYQTSRYRISNWDNPQYRYNNLRSSCCTDGFYFHRITDGEKSTDMKYESGKSVSLSILLVYKSLLSAKLTKYNLQKKKNLPPWCLCKSSIKVFSL